MPKRQKGKVFTSTPKDNRNPPEDDDMQMALALSISTENLRRKSSGFISTQEYQEDESRRSSIVRESLSGSRDMFLESEEVVVGGEVELGVEVEISGEVAVGGVVELGSEIELGGEVVPRPKMERSWEGRVATKNQ